MIVFEDFIKAIHDAVLAANSSLSQRNLDLLDEYFEDSGKVAAVQGSLDAALKATQDLLNNPRPGRDSYLNVKKTLEEASRALAGDDLSGNATTAQNPESYTPKTVTLQYSGMSENGVVKQDVSVPLITLVPMPSTQIAQARFKTKLEVQEENGKLMIGFPSKVQMATPSDTSPYFTEFEVILEPRKEAEGLRRVVEGYEKILRAQLPN